MGKAVPRNIKARAEIFLEERPELFSTDFDKNKESIAGMELPLSKKTRNLMVGFITRKKRQEKIKEEKAKKA